MGLSTNLWLNGLGSPLGIETLLHTTVALREGEEETSPLGRPKKPQQLRQMGLQRGCCLLQDRNRQILSRAQTQSVTLIAHVPMRAPGTVGHPYHLMMGGEATLSANEAKRGLRGE